MLSVRTFAPPGYPSLRLPLIDVAPVVMWSEVLIEAMSRSNRSLSCRKSASISLGDRYAGLRLDQRGIYRPVVDPHLIVQVRARGEPRSADIADDAALVHLRAVPDTLGDLRQMSVIGFITISVLEDDQVAVFPPVAGKKNGPVTDGGNRRPRGRRIIEAVMGTEIFRIGWYLPRGKA